MPCVCGVVVDVSALYCDDIVGHRWRGRFEFELRSVCVVS